MPLTPPPHGDPVRSLEDRADALERRTARGGGGSGGAEGRAVDQAYKLVAELLAGPLVGLALGFGVQRLVPPVAPWGLIGGVLLGFAAALWMAKRTADRLSARAATETTRPAPAVTRIEDEDEA